ncbi:hypothetical protein HK405_014971 [Cladochytrium tenue]|nr:hypothetical protein HK405_014971 [Cladochytrium tenue]
MNTDSSSKKASNRRSWMQWGTSSSSTAPTSASASADSAAAMDAAQLVQTSSEPPAYSVVAAEENDGALPSVPAPIAPAVSHAVVGEDDVVLITLQPTAADADAVTERAPIDVVCVVDLSGSMDAAATLTANKTKEDTGLTVLDVGKGLSPFIENGRMTPSAVKHALKTIISSLSDDDNVAIVSFDDNAMVEMELTQMNEKNRDKAQKVINSMYTKGSTNIWAGLDLALTVMAKDHPGDSRLRSILLFTDGMPNVRPPTGEIDMLQKRKKNKFHGQLPCTIQTFGFGTQLDSPLLADIASVGNGSFSFIPDASMVGTVFVDTAANLLSVIAKDILISVETVSDAEIYLYNGRTTFGGHAILDTSSSIVPTFVPAGRPGKKEPEAAPPASELVKAGKKMSFFIGSICSGQSKDLALLMKNLPSAATTTYLNLSVQYTPVRGSSDVPQSTSLAVKSRLVNEQEVLVQHARLTTVDSIYEARKYAVLRDYDHADAIISEQLNVLRNLDGIGKGPDDRILALIEDVQGQVKEALMADYFNKWGSHYLLSLAGAHCLQICNNFKDPGVQVYAGQLFSRLRDEINEIFLQLPAPKPSRRAYGTGAAPAAPINMASFYDRNGGCFAGFCLAEVLDNDGLLQTVPVAQLKKGDLVRSTLAEPGNLARVVCVVEFALPAGSPPQLTRVPGGASGRGLYITPTHPIRATGGWVYPHDAEGARDAAVLDVTSVYSVLLERADGDGERASSIVLEGAFECVALAHGLTGAVVEHDYLGTERVARDVARLPGFAGGRARCGGLLRDSETGFAIGLLPAPRDGHQAQLRMQGPESRL